MLSMNDEEWEASFYGIKGYRRIRAGTRIR